MRKTKVDHKKGLIGAHRKIRQTGKYALCLPLEQDEAKAVMQGLEQRKFELLRRRKDFQNALVQMATELGGQLVPEAPDLPHELLDNFTVFVEKVKRAEGGEKYVQYTAAEATSYFDYLDYMDSRIEELFEMTRNVEVGL